MRAGLRFSSHCARRHSNVFFALAASALALSTGARPAAASSGLETRFIYDMSMQGELWGSDIDSHFQFDNDLHLSTMDARLSGSGFQSEFGNVSDNWDDLSFAGRGFRGFKLGIPTGKKNTDLSTSLLGGNIVIRDLQGRSVVSPVFGVRASRALGKSWTLNASQLWTPRASTAEGKAISALSLNYLPQKNTRLALEMARSSGGIGWQLSGERVSKNLSIKALVRHADANFSAAGNPLLSTQRSGYLADMRYKSGAFTFSAASQRYDDGRGGRDFYDSASLQFSKRKLPTLTLYWRQSDRLSLPYELLELDANDPARYLKARPTQSTQTGFQVSQSRGATSWSMGLNRSTSRVTNVSLSEQTSNRFHVGISRRLSAQTSISLFHSWDISSMAQANADQLGLQTQLNINHNFRNGIGVNVSLLRQDFRSAQMNSNSLNAQIGLQLPIGDQTSLGLDYRVNLSGSGPLSGQRDVLQFQLSRRFNIGKKRAANARTMQQRRALGRIIGRVFDDANNNGIWDAGELPLSNVAVALSEDNQRRSDRAGQFGFEDMETGARKLSLVMKTLPIEYTILGATEVSVPVVADKTANVNFAAVRTGTIKGIVFLDANHNGRRDENEKLLSDVMVQVEGSDVISFSNEKGEFTLSNLPPQRWKISANTQYLAEEYEQTGGTATEVVLAPNQVVSNIEIGLAPPQREVVSSFQKAS